MTATATESAREIGAIIPDPRYPDSVRLLVQGRLFLTIPRETARAEALEVGRPITEALYQRLCRAADLEAGYRTALRLLTLRPFAVRDLTRRLILKGHPPAAAAAAVERAGRAGLVDDQKFAQHYIATRAARGRGPLRLRRDLAALGVERGVIDRALADTLGPDGQAGPDVAQLARRRMAQLKGIPRPALRRRLMAYLARRGFAGRAARATVDAVMR